MGVDEFATISDKPRHGARRAAPAAPPAKDPHTTTSIQLNSDPVAKVTSKPSGAHVPCQSEKQRLKKQRLEQELEQLNKELDRLKKEKSDKFSRQRSMFTQELARDPEPGWNVVQAKPHTDRLSTSTFGYFARAWMLRNQPLVCQQGKAAGRWLIPCPSLPLTLYHFPSLYCLRVP